MKRRSTSLTPRGDANQNHKEVPHHTHTHVMLLGTEIAMVAGDCRETGVFPSCWWGCERVQLP